MSSPFENASERLSALMERASGLLEDTEDTPSPAERVMGAGSVEAEPLRLLREAIELNRAQLEAFREYSRRYDEELSEQRRNAAVQAEQSRKVNILSLAIAALSLVFAIAAVLAPYIWPQPQRLVSHVALPYSSKSEKSRASMGSASTVMASGMFQPPSSMSM